MSRFIPKAQVEHNQQSLRRTHLESEHRAELEEIRKLVDDNVPGAPQRLLALGFTQSHVAKLMQRWIWEASKRDARLEKIGKTNIKVENDMKEGLETTMPMETSTDKIISKENSDLYGIGPMSYSDISQAGPLTLEDCEAALDRTLKE